jgi:cysteine-rich repeat protein
MEVDLSNAIGANDLELAFDFSHHGEESNTNDRVWIRGSDTDAWIEIYDWDANKGAAGAFISVSSLDIDDTLTTNGQSVSDTFGIRFGQEDNFSALNSAANDGFTVDNVEITGTPAGPSVDETCDDGDATSGDGCSDVCQVEPGYTCVGEPSICTLDNCDPDNVILSYLVPSVDENTISVTFDTFTTKTYNQVPLVLATPQTDNNTNNYPIPVITNVTTGGFDISICVDAGDVTCAT